MRPRALLAHCFPEAIPHPELLSLSPAHSKVGNLESVITTRGRLRRDDVFTLFRGYPLNSFNDIVNVEHCQLCCAVCLRLLRGQLRSQSLLSSFLFHNRRELVGQGRLPRNQPIFFFRKNIKSLYKGRKVLYRFIDLVAFPPVPLALVFTDALPPFLFIFAPAWIFCVAPSPPTLRSPLPLVILMCCRGRNMLRMRVISWRFLSASLVPSSAPRTSLCRIFVLV